MINKESIHEAAKEWENVWQKRPFENNNGLGCQGAFALYYFLREMSPTPEIVYEIGTWRGFSTWVIRMALPRAKIVCSDPILASRQFLDQKSFLPEFRLEDVEYTWQDFSNMEILIPPLKADKAVVFFDDHQNKASRVKQAAEKGIKHIIFDDNTPFQYTHKTFEYQFLENPQSKKETLQQFSRYEIFPPLFDGINRGKIPLKGIFKEDLSAELKGLYSQRDLYSWVTKVELYER